MDPSSGLPQAPARPPVAVRRLSRGPPTAPSSGSDPLNRRRQSSLSSQLSLVTSAEELASDDAEDEVSSAGGDHSREASSMGDWDRVSASESMASGGFSRSGSVRAPSAAVHRGAGSLKRSSGTFFATPLPHMAAPVDAGSPSQSAGSMSGSELDFDLGLSPPSGTAPALPPAQSHRLSTTPLFPSPLAHAMLVSQDEDNEIDPLDIDSTRPAGTDVEDGDDEAETEPDEPTEAARGARQRTSPSPTRPIKWSPLGLTGPALPRSGSPLRRQASDAASSDSGTSSQALNFDEGSMQRCVRSPPSMLTHLSGWNIGDASRTAPIPMPPGSELGEALQLQMSGRRQRPSNPPPAPSSAGTSPIKVGIGRRRSIDPQSTLSSPTSGGSGQSPTYVPSAALLSSSFGGGTAPTVPIPPPASAPLLSRKTSASILSPRSSTSGSGSTGSPATGYSFPTAPPSSSSSASAHHHPRSSLSLTAPPESIKLQRVPTSVRLAQSIGGERGAFGSTPMSSRGSSSSGHGGTSGPHNVSPADGSASDSGTPTSRGSLSRRRSRASPVMPSSADMTAVPSDSGEGLLVPGAGRRERARTTQLVQEGRPHGADFDAAHGETDGSGVKSTLSPPGPSSRLMGLGPSPGAPSFGPLQLAGMPTRAFSANMPAQSQLIDRLTSKSAGKAAGARLSVGLAGEAVSHSTDEYARIIAQSRTAKMHKWMPRSASGGPPMLTPALPMVNARSTEEVPPDGDIADFNSQRSRARATSVGKDAAPPMSAISSRPTGYFDSIGSSSSTREVEWVDWLEEYRQLKEAKLRAEGGGSASLVQTPSGYESTLASSAPSPASMLTRRMHGSLDKGKGRSRESSVDLASYSALETRRSSASSIEPGATPSPERSNALMRSTSSSTRSQAPLPLASTTSTTGGRRKKGAFARIDAWWSGVRGSVKSHDGSKRNEASTSTAAPPPPPLSRHYTREGQAPLRLDIPSEMPPPASPRRTVIMPPTTTDRTRSAPAAVPQLPPGSGLPVPSPLEMPPPPVPIRRLKTLDGAWSQSPPSGALAPAARIAPGDRIQRSTSPPGYHSSDLDGTQRDTRRRNPHLSLRLDSRGVPRVNSSAGTDSSGSGGIQPTSGSFFSPPLSAARLSGYEQTPALTPGSGGQMWDRTPGLVPSSSSAPVRPPLPRQGSSSSQIAGQTLSMTVIRQQIKQRLQLAKESCDRDLRKITHGITVFVEHELAVEQGAYQDGTLPSSDHDAAARDAANALLNPPPALPSDLGLESDVPGSEAGDESDRGSTSYARRRRSRAASNVAGSGYVASAQSAPGSSSTSPTMGPISLPLQRQSSAPKRGRQVSVTGGTTSPRRVSTAAGGRSSALGRSFSGQGGSTAVSSAASSRSTSRSRSPLPGHVAAGGPGRLLDPVPSRQSSDPQPNAFVATLQDMIAVATEILDTSVATLIAEPSHCHNFIQRVQRIGMAWEHHPDWPKATRGWYVSMLLAIASLSRVVEWWDAEKSFWRFDETDEATDEPIVFVAKAAAPDEDGSGRIGGPRRGSRDKPISAGRSRAPSVAISSPSARVAVDADSTLTAAPTDMEMDIGEGSMIVLDPSSDPPPGVTAASSPEVARAEAEEFKSAVEQVRSATILMELDLDQQRFLHLSPVWHHVVGLEPAQCIDQPIANLLFPPDANVFAEATRQLLADDSHTVEVVFRLRVISATETEEEVYEVIEGKGLLMRDRQTGDATHTMWVLSPAAHAAGSDGEEGDEAVQPRFGLASHQRSSSDGVVLTGPLALGRSMMTENVLCRICERPIQAWFFEKHNDTCNETHRLELEIGNANEALADLKTSIKSLRSDLEALSGSGSSTPPTPVIIEYRGVPMLISSPGASSPLSPAVSDGELIGAHGRRLSAASPRPQHLLVRRLQLRYLEQLLEVVQNATDISTPSLADDDQPTADEPIEKHVLLSPTSEDLLSTVMNWQRPPTEDPALVRLATDVEDQVRIKLDAINRLRNTIIYSERVRREWEIKANLALPAVSEETSDRSPALVDEMEMEDEGEGDVTVSSAPAVEALIGSLAGLGLDTLPAPAFASTEPPTPGTRARLLPTETPSHSPRRVPSPRPLAPEPTPPGSPLIAPGSRRTSNAGVLNSPSMAAPQSPRIPLAAPPTRTKANSIKDFDIIKPISKGAYGSVYLAKKKTTGDYFAIKVLKKSDMITKNQVTNVKAERMILMTQADSDFVVKLFFTFQSKDYLYLVMEYLNGGDCAALIKALGSLEEDWARNYIAEVVLGLEYLHKRGIVHRDLKPDNLLIDSRGHLKLTDFGLSKTGVLGRQAGPIFGGRTSMVRARPSFGHSRDRSVSSQPSTPGDSTSQSEHHGRQSYFESGPSSQPVAGRSQSSASGSDAGTRRIAMTPGASGQLSGPPLSGVSGASDGQGGAHRTFVGTPDYLAPESILGIGMGTAVDWWALGVICYEFLFGAPPFHAETPERVFENIISRRINWYEDEFELSAEARDFMERLMCSDSAKRLGANGADEVKQHPFLQPVDWANLMQKEAAFVPQVTDPESTDYFDSRGAIAVAFDDEAHSAAPVRKRRPSSLIKNASDPALIGLRRSPRSASGSHQLAASASADHAADRSFELDGGDEQDFGGFSYKNLDVLKQENDRVIAQLRGASAELSASQTASAHALGLTLDEEPLTTSRRRSRPVSLIQPPRLPSLLDSPSTTSSPSASSPSVNNSTPTTPFGTIGHARRPSEIPPSHRLQPRAPQGRVVSTSQVEFTRGHVRRASMPTRLRTRSLSSADRPLLPVESEHHTPATSIGSPPTNLATGTPLNVLVADDNPISATILSTILTRMGCRTVVVHDGSEALRCAMGNVRFDVIYLDLSMPLVDGPDAARMLRSTNNINMTTPLVAVSAFTDLSEANTIWDAVMSKPVSRSQCTATLSKLGFVTRSAGPAHAPGVAVAAHRNVTG